MSRALALEQLGLSSQDWGPCYGDNFTHAEFAAAWRGLVACPTEQAILQADILPAVRKSAKIKIDIAAGDARARKVSKGELIDQEYVRAYEDSVTYKNAGYAGTVPNSVQSWATAKGWTAQQAADDIIATRNGWMAVLDSIRSNRLSGKANVDVATTEAGVISARDAAVNALNAL